MTSSFDDLIRDALNDVAAQARPVILTESALRLAPRRRRAAIGVSTATSIAAVALATPFALAVVGSAGPMDGPPSLICPVPTMPPFSPAPPFPTTPPPVPTETVAPPT